MTDKDWNIEVNLAGTEDIIAVAGSELELWGCPYCGYRSGSMPFSDGGAGSWVCGECHKCCVALAEGVTRSRMAIIVDEVRIYPELREHPRKGTPAHGRPDNRPEEGEHFGPRGIGFDHTPGCFVCGGVDGLHQNIAAFVQCKAAGERVVTMFQTGARLDYREYEPDYVQVKIGACDKHADNLELLYSATRGAGGVITSKFIAQAINPPA